MQSNSISAEYRSASYDDSRKSFIKRVCKGNMALDASLKERKRSDPLGAIDDLIRDDKVPRLDVLPQTAHCRKGDDGPDAQGSECGDIRSAWYLVRCDLMMQTMSCQERNVRGRSVGRCMAQYTDRRRRPAPWRVECQGRTDRKAG